MTICQNSIFSNNYFLFKTIYVYIFFKELNNCMKPSQISF